MSAPFVMPPLGPIVPELILAIGALVMVLVGALRGERSYGLVNGLAFLVLAGAGAALFMQSGERVLLFGDSFAVDAFGRFMKLIAVAGAGAALVLSLDYLEREKIQRFEFPILIILATLGMMMMISANDLIALYMGLELQSLAAYVVASLHRDNARSSEAGLKYFVLGALSSGMLLYGASLVYGFAGTVSFPGIAEALQGRSGIGVIVGLVFVSAGLAFKISAVPFHMWTPDVYEGAPTPVAAFFASAPKVAAMAMMVRVFITAFPGIVGDWRQIVVFISIASMALGAFAAIGQRNIKRLMAYSSIGHVGYALVGLAAGTQAGVNGVALYMAIYVVMTLGAFAMILGMRRGDDYVETIDDLAGLSRTQPMLAFAFAMMLFSLIGVPPLAGFFAKFYVFAAAVEAKLVTLAVIGMITSVIGAFYYLRIIQIMYFKEPAGPFSPVVGSVRAVIALSAAFILLFWLMPGPLVAQAASAARSLF